MSVRKTHSLNYKKTAGRLIWPVFDVLKPKK